MTLLNRALWRKTVAEALILLIPCTIVVFGFTWLFVYLMNQLKITQIPGFLKMIVPSELMQLNSMSIDDWGTRRGLLSVIYVHPVIEFTCIVWAMIRGSAAISGEISRGTMEILISQPISRTSLVVVNGVTAVLGAAVLTAATLAGLAAGVATVPPRENSGELVQTVFFIPAAVNLFCYTVCMCGICTLISSWDHYRFRTIGLIGIFEVSQIVMDVTVRWVGAGNPLKHLAWGTIKTCFEPQLLIFAKPDRQIHLSQEYAAVFLGIALLSYVLAAAVFARRDLPTPL